MYAYFSFIFIDIMINFSTKKQGCLWAMASGGSPVSLSLNLRLPKIAQLNLWQGPTYNTAYK